MIKDKPVKLFKPEQLILPVFAVLTLWLVYYFEIKNGVDFSAYGLKPRKIEGLVGVLASPFIHANTNHLINNSFPLFVFLFFLNLFYKEHRTILMLLGFVLSGVLTWFIGTSGNHIGASGIVYMLFSYLFFKGIFTRYYRLMALSLLIIFLYGNMIWYMFPVDLKISWEGHLSGFIVGFIFAVFLKKKNINSKVYSWQKDDFNPEEDEFLMHFDEKGNFIDNRFVIDEEE